MNRPGILSVRAINQYRRRDVLIYLGLRYYLHNSAARTDQWARQVATDLVLTRSSPSYFPAQHYKEISKDGNIEHRPIFLPAANEALAEAALLDQCAGRKAFANPPRVFSYSLNDRDRRGIYKHYVEGLQGRHAAIAKACEDSPNGIVRYMDIKHFYPSIGDDLAIRVWNNQSKIAGLPEIYRELGMKLIRDHAQACKSLLTGPMLSHLLANLVLRELDEAGRRLPAEYFRYVDDITLVGSADEVKRSQKIIHDHLQRIGLELHGDDSPKTLEIPATEWLEGREDFAQNDHSIGWMRWICDLKEFLLLRPGQRVELQQAFRSEGFRVPVPDYSAVAHESAFMEGLLYRVRRFRFRKNRPVTIQTLVSQGIQLNKMYQDDLRELFDGASELRRFDRKRRIPKLRYRTSRLIYLAPNDALLLFSRMADELPELYFQSRVMEAVASADISQLLSLGTNAAQAAAQPLRASGKGVIATQSKFEEVEKQGLAIFLLNGVPVDLVNRPPVQDSELVRFSNVGADVALMRSNDPFLRELACLHGLTPKPRHPEMLETAFDEDEDLAADAVDQMQQSLSP